LPTKLEADSQNIEPPIEAPKEIAENFPIVAIGASAGGLKPMLEIVQQLDAEPNLAIVFVQHLDPAHRSELVDIISRSSSMSVVQVEDGMNLTNNRTYVIPEDSDLALQHTRFQLRPRSLTDGIHLPINEFFTSLAENAGRNAVGVVLSGTGRDGALGLEAIKSSGGVTLVQSTETAEFPEMPSNAIVGSDPDYILSPTEIGKELMHLAQHPLLSAGTKTSDTFNTNREDSDLSELFQLIRAEKSVDFSAYKPPTIKRRIYRRLILRRLSSISEYLRLLKSNHNELDELFHDLLISVTSFFREPESFDAVRRLVFPKLVETPSLRGTKSLRIWVPGCASGEEPYSIAIALIEFLESKALTANIQIFATDISERAIAKARAGIYSAEQLAPISAERKARFFTKTEHGYLINKSIRDMVVFAIHNVVKDPPFSHIDFISCRNLLIYFSSTLQANVISMFHFALRPDGMLLLGPAESITDHSDLFSIVDKKHRIFSRSHASSRQYTDNLIDNYYSRALPIASRQVATAFLSAEDEVLKTADLLVLSRFAPSGFVVTEAMKIIQFRGNTSAFLGPSPGHPNLNLIDMLRSELRAPVRAAMSNAARTSDLATDDSIEIRGDGDIRHCYKLSILPLPRPVSQSQHYLVLFSPLDDRLPGDSTHKPFGILQTIAATLLEKNTQNKDSELTRSLSETQDLKRQLATLAAERDLTLEELRTSNEEILSSNEELQSSNEELETAKEELQSSNEELRTVNDELQVRNRDLTQTRDDLSNIISSTNFPLILLGNDLSIRRFTPAAERLLGLLPGDIGRGIATVRIELGGKDLYDQCLSVLATMQFTEQQVKDRQGRWYTMTVRPYRTTDNKLDGLVISFFDVNTLTADLSRRGMDLAARILEATREPLLVVDERLTIRMINFAFQNFFGSSEAIINQDLTKVGLEFASDHDFQAQMRELVSAGTEFRDQEITATSAQGIKKTFMVNGSEIFTGSGERLALLYFNDITEPQKWESALRQLLNSLPVAVIQARESGQIVFVTDEILRMQGSSRKQILGNSIEILFPDRLVEKYRAISKSFFDNRTPIPLGTVTEFTIKTQQGGEILVDIAQVPYDRDGERYVLLILVDRSQRAALQKSQQLIAISEQANAAKSRFIATMSHEVRTPLSAILGFTEQLQQHPDQAGKFIPILRRNAEYLAQLVNEILDLSKIEANQINLEKTKFSLSELLDSVMTMFKDAAESKHLSLILKTSEDLPKNIYTDRTRLIQILVNLIGNALKFTDHGSISLMVDQFRTASNPEHPLIRFVVTDSGCGIPIEKHLSIFEPFGQAALSTSRVFGGTGLGLTISRQLARLLGGEVILRESRPEQGSSFEVTIDCLNQGDAASTQTISSNVTDRAQDELLKLKGARVLLVEDSPDISTLVEMILKRAGVRLSTAADGKRGLEMALSDNFDAILMDIQIPFLNGKEVTEELRRRGIKTPIIALTAHATKEESAACLNAGMNQYCTKPLSANELCAVLASWL
jgi:two-component system CheB/CheR fusion protein